MTWLYVHEWLSLLVRHCAKHLDDPYWHGTLLHGGKVSDSPPRRAVSVTSRVNAASVITHPLSWRAILAQWPTYSPYVDEIFSMYSHITYYQWQIVNMTFKLDVSSNPESRLRRWVYITIWIYDVFIFNLHNVTSKDDNIVYGQQQKA